ncbi:hypothetical protein AAG570_001458 [Ranatra chinensis]|uniref:Uncharacterized protein n=1 Tax=Ranatra chinensis TaxID=642074 RepID=A0ABD0Y8L0_9HEMI
MGTSSPLIGQPQFASYRATAIRPLSGNRNSPLNGHILAPYRATAIRPLTGTRNFAPYGHPHVRFPCDGAVELHFCGRLEGGRQATPPAPTPAVPVHSSPDPVTRWDSYEHLDHPPPLSPPDSDDTEDTNGQ